MSTNNVSHNVELPPEASWITKDILEGVLRETGGDCEVVDVQISPANKDGESCYGVVLLVHVTTRDSHGDITKRHLAVKSTLTSESSASMAKYLSELKVNEKEVMFYTEIVPLFRKFINQGKGPEVDVPKMLGVSKDGDRCLIMMEDVSHIGYRKAPDLTTLDLDHCKLVLDAMARFHALGYKLKASTTDDNLRTTFPLLFMENFQSDFYYTRWGGMFNATFDAVEEIIPTSRLSKSVTDAVHGIRTFDYLSMIKASITSESEGALSTICIRESTSRNMLFKYDSTNGRPTDAMLLDFQLIQLAPPASDVAVFLYTSTDLVFEEDKLDHLLRFYHDRLHQNLDILGIKLEFPFTAFRDQFVKTRGPAIWLNFTSYPWLTVKPEYFPMEMLENPNMPGLGKLLKMGLEKSGTAYRIVKSFKTFIEDGFLL